MRKFLARFRQAPVFSTVYILGAALSVASVMLVAIFLHVKTSNIYPEYSRDKLLYLNYAKMNYNYRSWQRLDNSEDRWTETESGKVGYHVIDLLKDSLDAVASIAIEVPLSVRNVYVDGKRFDNITVKFADSGIFDIFNYKVLEGKPFTKEDVDTDQLKVMISDRLARRLFGTDREIVGRTFILDNSVQSYHLHRDGEELPVTVCGVFDEGSKLLGNSYAEIIAPINKKTGFGLEQKYHARYVTGEFQMIVKPDEGVPASRIAEIVKSQVNRFNSNEFNPGGYYVETSYYYNKDGELITEKTETPVIYKPGYFHLDLGNAPRSSLQMELGNPDDPYEKFDASGITKLYGLLILVLLLVPALNLSSLISGNMDSKMSEMGIRKAFGASNATLLRQVLTENLWLTGCGALLGVLFSWIGVVLWKDWLFTGITETAQELSANDIMLDPAMLFAPKVFIIAVVVCFVLNLLSSLIPAWWSLRRPAIDSIKVKS